MQEEVTGKTVTLIVNGAKMSEQVFEKAVKKFLEEIQKSRQPKIYRGKQTLKQLASQNTGLANIEISDKNIRAFTHVAKKYHVDFALKKDTAAEQPRYLVFFKSRDADAITAAFQEFASRRMGREEKPAIRDLMETDELELDTLGDSKTALFVIISDTDSTFNFVAALMYSQLFNLLCDKADDFYGGRLPVHVRLILDEFANIGQIPNFDKLIATIRSREISASIILQSQSQLKTIYKDAADTIVGNCDSTLFLGGKEKSTLKEISELLGKETIDSYNQSENRGAQTSHGLNYQKLGKELMTQDELAVMDGGKCIFMLRGVRPFLSEKYDLTKHPNYRYTADADPKNVFDMERYMKKQRAVVKPTDSFEVYEIDVTE